MAPLVGEYRSTLDQKGRLIVPHKLRAMGGTPDNPCSTFVLVPGPEHSVWAYTPEGWEATAGDIIQGKHLPGQDLRRFQRKIGSLADYVACDRQGRIVLPQKLQEHAGLTRDIVWLGAIDRAEIWDAARWDKYDQGSPQSFEEIYETMTGDGATGKAPQAGTEP